MTVDEIIKDSFSSMQESVNKIISEYMANHNITTDDLQAHGVVNHMNTRTVYLYKHEIICEVEFH